MVISSTLRTIRLEAAFSVAHTLVARESFVLRCMRSTGKPPFRSLPSLAHYRTYHPALVPRSGTQLTCPPIASATISYDRWSDPLRFDKIPNKLPDWWDDEEDEDDDAADDRDDRSGSGNTDGGGGGGGGGGDGHDDEDPEVGFFGVLLAMYTRAIRNAPIRTKATSTCTLALLGDLLAQKMAHEKGEFSWDRRRTMSVGIWSFFFMGPVLHFWYGALDRLFHGPYAIWQKLLCDQLMFAPFFNTAFIAGIGSLEGNRFQDVSDTIKSKFWPSMKANYALWPAAQFINFSFVPKTFQIAYINSVALVWNIILTYISHGDEEPKPALTS